MRILKIFLFLTTSLFCLACWFFVLSDNYAVNAVEGHSMDPTLKQGDAVLLEGIDRIEDIKPGLIVRIDEGKKTTIHRVAEAKSLFVITKGDNNKKEDQIVPAYCVKWACIGRIPLLGYLYSTKIYKIPLAIYVLLFFLVGLLYCVKGRKMSKTKLI